MNKIAIISEFNRNSVNYGNRLQAMALNQYLRKNYSSIQLEYLYFSFYDNFTITKKPNIKNQIKRGINFIINLKSKLNRIYSTKIIKNRLIACESFSIKNMTLANKAYIWSDLKNSDFDTIIIGSDVVWTQINGKIGKLRFLDFELSKPFNRIAYAASFGRDWIPKENISEIQRCLKKFNAISVRENSSVKLLDSIGIKSIHTVDPTLLLSKNEWIQYEQKPKKVKNNEKYIFVYLLGTDKTMRKNIKIWAKENTLKIITIPYACGTYNKFDSKFGDLQIMDCSPESWLWLIRHAEYVLTDSFHGSVFSTIFEKKLVVLERKEKIDINNRMIDFMNMIKQSNKIIKYEELECIKNLNWNYLEINKILQKEIEHSKKFINDALKKYI